MRNVMPSTWREKLVREDVDGETLALDFVLELRVRLHRISRTVTLRRCEDP